MRWAILLTACASLAFSQEVKRPRITGVAHIAFMAHDFSQSRVFYTGIMGLQEPYSLKNPDIAFFKINDRQYVELFPEKQPNTDRLVNIGLETDNAEQLRKYLASRGVAVPNRVTKDRIGNRTFTVTDPEKHIVEFVQYEPNGWSMREKGKFMDDRRVSSHASHVGIISLCAGTGLEVLPRYPRLPGDCARRPKRKAPLGVPEGAGRRKLGGVRDVQHARPLRSKGLQRNGRYSRWSAVPRPSPVGRLPSHGDDRNGCSEMRRHLRGFARAQELHATA
jgi:catechol 2,3-dioxygenase-like lactoylglutathione lyase family enzyme